ncbi:hypothetical protein EQM14_09855 [Caproiciproducens sp. NJN-50]|uniref:PfkB family carbohydrate kinase n=1 Tax=Acutalibacteraceae TaxID=3082771 RepID=UPI000FFDFCEE|nr:MULTISPECIES: PfkB family carbohydrate kinase [Acutalibacteraceae]QAT50049.1 hypothetical protein EQM14_09855 [Caproiciproducens sp. NJN-50]
MPGMESPKIVSFGVLNVDFVMELGNETIGKKRIGKQISINAGGHGSSQAIAAVRDGISTAVIGKIGDDAFGQQIEATLRKEKVDCRFLSKMQGVHSGLATILVENQKENIFIDFLGANYKLTKEDIDLCCHVIQTAELVMIHMGPAMIDVAYHVVDMANEYHVPVLVCPSMSIKIPQQFLEKVDYLVLNLSQASSICGLNDETVRSGRIAASLLSSIVRKNVIVQMDANGVLVSDNGLYSIMNSVPEQKIVDYSGAIDFFVGVLAAEIVKGKTVQEAAIKAHKAAILCMQTVGVYASFPSAESLETL